MTRHNTVRHTEPSDFGALHKIVLHSQAVRGTAQLPYPSAESWRRKLENPPLGFYSLIGLTECEVVGHLGLQAAANPRRRRVGSLGMAVRDD